VLVVDRGDGLAERTWETDIMMHTPADRERLAREVLEFIGRL